MKELDQNVRDYVDAHRQEMLDLWRDLVNTESGPAQKEGVDAVNALLRREMEAAGMSTRVIPMEKVGDVLVADWDNGSKEAPVLLIGHMDTVFKPGAAEENPFRVDENGNAHGPGVLDMKGGVVIALYAVKALQAAGYCKRPVKFVLAGDEETLHQSSNAQQVMADEVRGGAAAFNFETGYPDDGIVVGRKGGSIVSFAVEGVAAHSGIAPEKGRSAVEEAAHKIISLQAMNDIPRGKLINCGMVSGGIGENTIAGACSLRCGLRFPTMEIKEELMAGCRAVADTVYVEGTKTTMKIEMVMDPMEHTEGVQKLYELVEETARDIGYGSVHPFEVGGVSDSSIAVVAGVPTVCGMGVKGEFNHTEKEYAIVESLFSRAKLAASAMARI